MKKDEKELYIKALKIKGLNNQLIVALEENMELSQSITKYIREEKEQLYGKEKLIEKIAEEICDVEIMCAQLKTSFGIEDSVGFYKKKKLERLEKRLKVMEGKK